MYIYMYVYIYIYIYIFVFVLSILRYIQLHIFFCLFVSTGPLLNEDMSVGCMPHKQYKDLTFSLSGKELGWRPHTHFFMN